MHLDMSDLSGLVEFIRLLPFMKIDFVLSYNRKNSEVVTDGDLK